MKSIIPIIICALLAGCFNDAEEKEKYRKAKEESKEELERYSNKKPIFKVHEIGDNIMAIIYLPVIHEGGSKGVQKCFLWKDASNNTSSLSCESSASFAIRFDDIKNFRGGQE